MGLNIIGAGMYVPETIADNNDFTKIVDTSDEWITTRTGIKTRHINNGELTFQMGAKAAAQAVKDAGIEVEKIDMVLGTTVTSDFLTPSLACMVAKEIGIEDAACMDLNAACSGYVFALDVAKKYLDSGEFHCILIVSSEIVTRMVDYTDRGTCVLFGDGAAATIVTQGEGLYAASLRSSPQGALKIFTKLPEPENPFKTKASDWGDERLQEAAPYHMQMQGHDVYKFATVAMADAVEQAAQKAGLSPEDLDIIIPHQANIRIVQTAIKRLKLPVERFYVNIQEYGNISSACIPLAITELKSQGRLKKGDKVCVVGFGAGLTYGAAVFEY